MARLRRAFAWLVVTVLVYGRMDGGEKGERDNRVWRRRLG